MSSKKVRQALLLDENLVSEVGQRIFLAPVEQGENTPHVAYEFEGDDPIMNLDGVALQRQIWALYITAKTFSVAERIKDVARAAMENTDEFSAAFQKGDYEFDEETKLHQFVIEYAIIY